MMKKRTKKITGCEMQASRFQQCGDKKEKNSPAHKSRCGVKQFFF